MNGMDGLDEPPYANKSTATNTTTNIITNTNNNTNTLLLELQKVVKKCKTSIT